MSELKIIIYGTVWCGDCLRSRRYLERNSIEYEWIDIDQDHQGELFVLKVNRGMRSVPTILLPNGSILVEPSNEELKSRLVIG